MRILRLLAGVLIAAPPFFAAKRNQAAEVTFRHYTHIRPACQVGENENFSAHSRPKIFLRHALTGYQSHSPQISSIIREVISPLILPVISLYM